MGTREGIWLGSLTKEELARLDGHETGDRISFRGEKWTLQFSEYYRQFYLEPRDVLEYMH